MIHPRIKVLHTCRLGTISPSLPAFRVRLAAAKPSKDLASQPLMTIYDNSMSKKIKDSHIKLVSVIFDELITVTLFNQSHKHLAATRLISLLALCHHSFTRHQSLVYSQDLKSMSYKTNHSSKLLQTSWKVRAIHCEAWFSACISAFGAHIGGGSCHDPR